MDGKNDVRMVSLKCNWWIIKHGWEMIWLSASRRGIEDISNGTKRKRKKEGETTYKYKKKRGQSAKVKLLLLNLPKLPFEEQIEFFGRFHEY